MSMNQLLLNEEWADISENILLAASTLKTQGRCLVSFPVAGLVAPVVKGWLQFLRQPETVKLRFSVGDSKDPDEGYILRSGEQKHAGQGGIYDQKELFHFRPNLISKFEEARVAYHVHAEWLDACQVLYDASLKMVGKIADGLDRRLPGYNMGSLVRNKAIKLKHNLRLLNYRQSKQPGEFIGKIHSDRNFLTFHLDESHPGLVYDCQGKRHEYKKIPGQVLVFPGKKMNVLTHGSLADLPHGVIAREDTISISRWSVVFFGHIGIEAEGETI